MSLTPEDIGAIVAAFEASTWTELSLQLGETRLELSRSGAPPHAAASATPPVTAPPSTPPVGAVPAPIPEPVAETVVQAHPAPTHGMVEVLAPTLGLFWRCPQPGAPPFVEVGQQVEPDDTVCIVEVMKLMSHVKAGIAGTVVGIPVENGSVVEYGDSLVVIEPAD